MPGPLSPDASRLVGRMFGGFLTLAFIVPVTCALMGWRAAGGASLLIFWLFPLWPLYLAGFERIANLICARGRKDSPQ